MLSVSTLHGALAAILILAAVLALPVSWILLYLYRRAVVRTMRRHASERPSQTAAPPPPPPGAAGAKPPLANSEALMRRAARGRRHAILVYACGAALFAGIMTAAMLVSGEAEFNTGRLAILWWTYAWPLVLTIYLVTGRWVFAAGYFAGYAAVCVYVIARNPEMPPTGLLLLWLVLNLLPTLLLVLFLLRGIRAVGPLVLAFMAVALTGADLSLQAAEREEGIIRIVVEIVASLGLGANAGFLLILLAGFVTLSFLGWGLLRWIGVRYQRRKLSDLSITVNALWLLFAVVYGIELMPAGAEWIAAGVAAFLVFRIATRAGFALHRPAGRAPTLLLLRVFSLGKRSEQLHDAFSARWRFVGETAMIAGPDLATSTIEPDEFLSFAGGRLATLFIESPATLERRLAEAGRGPDFDGRHRIIEFFCYDNTWRPVLARLAGECDAVLMDLRGFQLRNDGCKFEIRELFHLVPLARVVMVTDTTTDGTHLTQVLNEAAADVRPGSPNDYGEGGQIRFVNMERVKPVEMGDLLSAVCQAATASRDRPRATSSVTSSS